MYHLFTIIPYKQKKAIAKSEYSLTIAFFIIDIMH